MATSVAAHPGELLGEVPAPEELLHYAADDRAIEAVLRLIARCVARLERGEVACHTLGES